MGNRSVGGKDMGAGQAATYRVLPQGDHGEAADETSDLGCILEATP